MKTLIFSIVFLLIFLSYVQTRALKNYDSELGLSGKYFIEPPDYNNLLTFLNTRKTTLQSNHDNDDNDDMKDDDLIHDRRFFLFDVLRPKPGSKSSTAYGRKSHWDTFFG